MTDIGTERDDQQVGEGQPGEHHRDSPRFLSFVGKPAGYHGAYAEEGPMGQTCQQPHHQEGVVTGGDSGQSIEQGKNAHEGEQDLFWAKVAADGYQQRRAYHYAGGICRNKVTCRGNTDLEIFCDVGQKPHHNKFRSADAKTAQCEGN